jgi:N-acetylmuramoyl-L-alanine amidase
MEIKNNKLSGDLTEFRLSPNRGAPFAPPAPDTIVIHFTAGGSLESSVQTLSDETSKASAHVVVGRDGKIVQLVPFDTVAWHAGVSSFQGRTGFNRFSIGIEIDNAGRLTQTASGGFMTWFMKPIDKADAVQAVHRSETVATWWHAYTEVQIAKTFELCTLLIRAYNITSIVGHEEIAPSRKTDPGPAFPLDRLRDRLLGTRRDEIGSAHLEVGVISAALLNARAEPSTSSTVLGTPLPRGTSVQIVEARQGWLRIISPRPAWVKEEHVLREMIDFPSFAADGRPDSGGDERPGGGGGGGRPGGGGGEHRP